MVVWHLMVVRSHEGESAAMFADLLLLHPVILLLLGLQPVSFGETVELQPVVGVSEACASLSASLGLLVLLGWHSCGCSDL